MKQSGWHRSCRSLLPIVLCVLASVLWTDSIHVPGPLKNLLSSSRASNNEQKAWSSYLTVDPSKILSVLINRGGLLMPKSVETELVALANVLNVEEAKLNLVDRELLLQNFTVALPGNRDSLRVGRVHVKWDSYTRPCVQVEVKDVTVLLEFTNVALTRNNWNELEDAGFPPKMLMETSSSDAPSSTFVRVGGIHLSGNVTAQVFSRPLNRYIASIGFDMRSLRELNDNVRKASEANLKTEGRRGCTTDQVYDILQAYFSNKLRKFLKDAALDVTTASLSDEGRSNTIEEARRLVSVASAMMKSYASDVGKKTGDDLEDSLAVRLEKLGVPSSKEKLSVLRRLSLNTMENVDFGRLAKEQFQQVRDAYQTRRKRAAAAANMEEAAHDENEQRVDGAAYIQEQDILFADW